MKYLEAQISSPVKLSKEEKKKKIKEVLKEKLSISTIEQLCLGKKDKTGDCFRTESECANSSSSQKLMFSDIYKFKGLLGVGQFGVVMLVERLTTLERCALKVIYKGRLSKAEVDVIRNESEILEKFSDKSNVAQFKQMYETSQFIIIEMEYIQGGSLKKMLEVRLGHRLIDKPKIESSLGKTCPVFSEEEVSILAKGILQGLANVHEQDIIHRDLKLDNIMLVCNEDKFESEQIKLVDFGLSAKFKANPSSQIDDKIGTLLYMAPEQISNQKYGKKIDIFSCGIIIYYLLTGKHPLYKLKKDTQQTYKQKLTTTEPEKWFYPDYVSDIAKDLICRLCRTSQMQRYDAKRALKHPWITRRFQDSIPLSQGEEVREANTENNLRRVINTALFMAIVAKHNEGDSYQAEKETNAIQEFLESFDIVKYRERIKQSNFSQSLHKLSASTEATYEYHLDQANLTQTSDYINIIDESREEIDVNDLKNTQILPTQKSFSKRKRINKKDLCLIISSTKNPRKQSNHDISLLEDTKEHQYCKSPEYPPRKSRILQLLESKNQPNNFQNKFFDYQSSFNMKIGTADVGPHRRQNKTLSPNSVKKVLTYKPSSFANNMNFKLNKCQQLIPLGHQFSPSVLHPALPDGPCKPVDTIYSFNMLPSLTSKTPAITKDGTQTRNPKVLDLSSKNLYQSINKLGTQSNDALSQVLRNIALQKSQRRYTCISQSPQKTSKWQQCIQQQLLN